jgi:hypothetical protein
MVQLLMKAAEKEFGLERTTKACRIKVEQIHMRNIFVPKWVIGGVKSLIRLCLQQLFDDLPQHSRESHQ